MMNVILKMTFHATFCFYLLDYSNFAHIFGLKIALNMSIES